MKLSGALGGLLIIFTMLLTGCATTHNKNIVTADNSMESANADLTQTYAYQVKIYRPHKTLPEYYQILGPIAVDNYTSKGKKESKTAITRALREQASAIGANGVIHIVSGLKQTTADAVIIYEH